MKIDFISLWCGFAFIVRRARRLGSLQSKLDQKIFVNRFWVGMLIWHRFSFSYSRNLKYRITRASESYTKVTLGSQTLVDLYLFLFKTVPKVSLP